MEPFEAEFNRQPERNLGVITELVTGVAVRLESGMSTASTPRSFPDSAKSFALGCVEGKENPGQV